MQINIAIHMVGVPVILWTTFLIVRFFPDIPSR